MKDIIIAVFGLVLVFFISACIFNVFSYYECSTYQEMTGNKTRHVTFAGCYVEQGGKWIHYEEKIRDGKDSKQ